MDPVVLFAEEPRGAPSRYMDLIDAKSSLSSRSDSESVDKAPYSGGAVVLLSLRRRRKQGPTLPSRLAGVAEDCLLRLAICLDARLDRRRIRLPLPVLLALLFV